MLTTSTQTPDFWLEPEGQWLRFLKHHSVPSPPTNQKKVHELITHPITLSPVFKNPSLKATGEFTFFERELPILLAWHPYFATNTAVKSLALCASGTQALAWLQYVHSFHHTPKENHCLIPSNKMSISIHELGQTVLIKKILMLCRDTKSRILEHWQLSSHDHLVKAFKS